MKKSNYLLFALCALLASVLLLSACGKTEYEPFKVYFVKGGLDTMSAVDPGSKLDQYFTNVKIHKSDSSEEEIKNKFPGTKEVSFPDGMKQFSLKEVSKTGIATYETAEGEKIIVNKDGVMQTYSHSMYHKPMRIEGLEQISEEKAVETAKTYFEFFYGTEKAAQYQVTVHVPDKAHPYLEEGIPDFYIVSFKNNTEGYEWMSYYHVDISVDGIVLAIRDKFNPAYDAKDIPTGFAEKVEQAVKDCLKDTAPEAEFIKGRLSILPDGRYACVANVKILTDEGYVTWGFTVPIE